MVKRRLTKDAFKLHTITFCLITHEASATSLIEVKSCQMKTKGGKQGRKHQATQPGRFVLFPKTHEELRVKAAELGLEPQYLFVIAQINPTVKILDKRLLSWLKIDAIIKKARAYTRRKDGVLYTCIQHYKIFNQKRL